MSVLMSLVVKCDLSEVYNISNGKLDNLKTVYEYGDTGDYSCDVGYRKTTTGAFNVSVISPGLLPLLDANKVCVVYSIADRILCTTLSIFLFLVTQYIIKAMSSFSHVSTYIGMICISSRMFNSNNYVASKEFITPFLTIIVLCQLLASLRNTSALEWQNLSITTNYTFGTVLELRCDEGYAMKADVSELRINCSSSGKWVVANNEDELVNENSILNSCMDKDQAKILFASCINLYLT